MEGAIKRYRVMALVVGVMLLILVFVAMPVRYIGGDPTLSGIVSPIHGFLYMVYLVCSYLLWTKARWGLKKMLVMVSAGLVPFLAFFIERKIVREATELARAQRGLPAKAPTGAKLSK
ncbi:DUF3817 domain-containing protein [Actinomadura parmotrematis]|uniref:DUF3817 domain-containing protein n=1 Tax=Actinomadura parmotrematis TaxID=2864039 RepID=A0ABS7FQ29_9ACTN|nr:DUF3817 domain-containing protein [Actinomadura parmotrematis]MBW8482508.1 DUF3817 domain-containing protein [Actinomadura parmotrematis]